MIEPELLVERRGAAGLLTLNRPKALNALTLTMVRGIAAALEVWRRDSAITRVVIRGAGERAFCAGGDIRALHELGVRGRFDEMLTFWREEYALNVAIKRYPKPFIALVDGICMGGGVGVSLHGSHRVAGDRFQFAMPEVGIGFFPDVGATYMLPRLPGRFGTMLALSGERVKQAEAVAVGLATHAVRSADMSALTDAFVAGEAVHDALARFALPSPPPADVGWTEEPFSADGVGEVLARLDARASQGDERSGALAATIRTKSPTSLAIALEQMNRGLDLSFEDAMRTEFRIVSRVVRDHDFYEGVRALIIDKDNRPAWQPARPEDVPAAAIAEHFSPLGADELVLP